MYMYMYMYVCMHISIYVKRLEGKHNEGFLASHAVSWTPRVLEPLLPASNGDALVRAADEERARRAGSSWLLL